MNKINAKKVELVNLTKTFTTSTRGEVKAVQDVNFIIEPGEFITLLGPSGCGKTTLLRMIAGFELPTAGKILFDGEDIINKTPDKRDLGMVFQNYALFPHLNVFDNIAYGLKLKKFDSKIIKEKVLEGLSTVKMDDFSTRVPSQMSGGQQQRVALVRALVQNPGVLLFDEPLSNLDAKLRLHMRDEIRRIQQDIGITSIYVTHDQSEAMAMSDRIVILKDGIIQQIGTPQEIYHKPANTFVSNFIGKANIIEGSVVKINEDSIIIRIKDVEYNVKCDNPNSYLIDEIVVLVIRPEAVNLQSNDFKSYVKKTVYMGVSQDYWFDFLGTEMEISDYNPSAKKVYKKDEEIHFGFLEDSIHVLHKI